MELRILKKADGGGALTCTRHDGSVTWQSQHRHAEFFAPHDLTHYAVETVLQLDDAFYGLVSRGWEIDDFGPPWPRGPIPSRALFAELLVGLLDAERASGVTTSAGEMAAHMQMYAASHDVDTSLWIPLDEALLSGIRARRDVLIGEWSAAPVGRALTMRFPA
jgi:hypothetical protein